MYFVVTCRDAPSDGRVRALALPAHREHVDRVSGALVLSGPLLAADGETRVGQLFVLDVPDRAEVEQFVNGDPFVVAGVFADVQINAFEPKFRDGRRV